MANVTTNVDLQQISQKASELKTKANYLFDDLQRAQKAIDSTESNFQSGEGEEMRQQFAQYSKKFQQLQEDVTAFGAHADEFAKEFGTVQGKLRSLAAQLPSCR